jgi:peroxiredoxin
MPLKVGDIAPDFELPAVIGEDRTKFRLSDYRGKKNVILAFYPLDWTSTCTMHVPTYQTALEQLAKLDAQVAAISVDTLASHVAWQQKSIGMMGFPICSDSYPHGEVAKKYGLLRTGDPIPGINERAVFVVDKEGKLAFVHVYELSDLPDVDDVIEALEKLK